MKIDINCRVCGKEMQVYPSRLKNSKGVSCSIECANKAYIGSIRHAFSEEHRNKISIAKKGKTREKLTAPIHGENATYKVKHAWMNKIFGKPKYCEHCHSTEQKAYDWANVSGQYKMDKSDWLRLCRSCHMKYDAKLHNKNKEKFEHEGQFLTLKEIALMNGINYHSLYGRIKKYGTPLEESIKILRRA